MYATSFGWLQVQPMKKKSDAQKTLSLVFQRDGVPPKMIMGGSKEQTMGRFWKKCQDADCRIKQMSRPPLGRLLLKVPSRS
jgi:hypothetical protein